MKIGFIGIGDMGLRMARNVMQEYQLTVYNRTKSKAQSLVDEGARWVDHPSDMVADIVILMLSNDEACKEVILSDDGIIHSQNIPLVVNMSTVTPAFSTSMARTLSEHGISYLEAPVSGTLPHAEEASLIILVGGEQSLLDRVSPLLNLMGKSTEYLGEVGQAAKAKVLINSLLAVHTGILAEYLSLAQDLGLSKYQMLDIINDSALGNVVSRAKGSNMVGDRHHTLFRYRYIIKDLSYAMDTFSERDLDAPLIRKALEVYQQGGEDLMELDFSAVSRVYGLQ